MKKMKYVLVAAVAFCSLGGGFVSAQTDEEIVRSLNHYGKFENWTVRQIKESGVIGGQTKYLYECYGHPGDTVTGNRAFVAPEGYYWRTNNVLANVMGVVKTSCTDFPEKRGDGHCMRIETHVETLKVLGMINMEVVCQGTFLLGQLPEPITDTKNPLAKPVYGMPFHSRPAALSYDYKAEVGHETIRGTGFSKFKNMGYPDYARVTVYLQKRWEDEDGRLHALRVGTAVHDITESTEEWVNGYELDIHYGDITGASFYRPSMGLLTGDQSIYGLNSRGKNVPVLEEGWAGAEEEPNYMIILFMSSIGEAFYGGTGNALWLDNIQLEM